MSDRKGRYIDGVLFHVFAGVLIHAIATVQHVSRLGVWATVMLAVVFINRGQAAFMKGGES